MAVYTEGAKYNLDVVTNTTFEENLTWETDGGAAIDLTGCTAEMDVRADVDDASTLVTLTTANGKITLGGSTGTIDLTLLPADTSALTGQTGVYDLLITFPTGEVRRVLYGKIKFIRAVSR